jgi:hypothetical protein
MGHGEVSGVTGKASLKGEPSGIAAAITPWPVEKSPATRHLLIFRQALKPLLFHPLFFPQLPLHIFDCSE